ncbi:MAG: hypothetical protein AAFR58_12175 [Cyanobacteria bacterium J06627_28]
MTTTLLAAMSGDSPDARSAVYSLSSGRLLREAAECPRCSKRSIVKRSANTFACLNCGFHKDLPPVSPLASVGRSPLSNRPTKGRSERSSVVGEPMLHPPTDHALLPGRHPLNRRISVDPNLSYLEPLETEIGEGDKMQPLVFAAIAVIFGILFL